jgi:hypothetical protein
MKLSAETIHEARGRLIVAATFITMVVVYGVWYSYSVFLVALVREFGWSRSLVAAFSVSSTAAPGSHRMVGPPVRTAPLPCGAVVMGIGAPPRGEAWWHLLAFSGSASE